MDSINSFLKQMRQAGKLRNMKGKGDFGEDAVFAALHSYCSSVNGAVYRGFSYPYASDSHGKIFLGNIFRSSDGRFTDVTRQCNDEIDILLLTRFRIFPIEVKSYHASLEVYDHWVKYNGAEEDKSPVAQAEKHARHLYQRIYEYLPGGNPNYIRPIVCFADRCTVKDSRSAKFKYYIPVTILNNVKQCVADNDTPLDFALDIGGIKQKLNNIKSTSTRASLPP